MTARRIVVIQGHPDRSGSHFGHALAQAYTEGARAAGHEVHVIDVATLDVPILRSAEDFEHGDPPPSIRACQDELVWADHLVFFYPLWLGDVPALLKVFLEQLFRPAYVRKTSFFGRGVLSGKSVRVVVTMGMPAFVYRWYFHAHGLRNLEQNVLGFAGARPVRDTIVGGVATLSGRALRRWTRSVNRLGREAV